MGKHNAETEQAVSEAIAAEQREQAMMIARLAEREYAQGNVVAGDAFMALHEQLCDDCQAIRALEAKLLADVDRGEDEFFTAGPEAYREFRTFAERIADRSVEAMEQQLSYTEREADKQADMVKNPPHYTGHPKGIECIDVIEDNPYTLIATAMKYLWRVSWGGKENDEQDLRKAIEYLERELTRRSRKDVER